MNYERELRRLQRLLRADHQAFLDELDKPWPGMAEDLDMAIKILLTHAARSGDGRLPLLEACDVPDDPREAATVTLPAWWVEIIAAFRDLYEPAEAEYRAQKVLNELIGKQMGRDEPATCH
jgi:hypothetical protein